MVKMSEHEEFLSAEMVKNGDLLEIMNAGRFLTADETPFKRAAFQIEVRLSSGAEKTWTMNKTTRRRLAAAYGDGSVNWVGQKVRVELLKTECQGRVEDGRLRTPSGNLSGGREGEHQRGQNGAEKIEGMGWVMRKGLLPSADLSVLVLDNMFPHALDEFIESRRNGIVMLSTIKSCELWARARLKLLSNPDLPFDQHLHKCVALKVYDPKLIARLTFATFTGGEKPDVRYDPKIEKLTEQDQAILDAAWNVLRWNLSQEVTYTVPLELWPKIMEYSKHLELTFGNEQIPLFLRANPHKLATLAYCFALFEGTESTERHVEQAYQWLTECGVDMELDEFTEEWKKEHTLSNEEYLDLKLIIEAQTAEDMEEHGGELRETGLFKFFEHIARHGQARIAIRLPAIQKQQAEQLVSKGKYRNLSDLIRHALCEFLSKEGWT